jgi:hypothetical protein
MFVEEPHISHTTLAREVYERLHSCSPTGKLCLSSVKVALHRLQDLALIQLPESKSRTAPPHHLRALGQPLPGVEHVPCRVDQVQWLQLHLVSGADNPLHGLWNDLIIQQYPCGNAPGRCPNAIAYWQRTWLAGCTGIRTNGLGSINQQGSQGLFLHSMLAYRPDGIPLGVLNAQAWGRRHAQSDDPRTRNAKSIDEKESVRWLDILVVAATAARRMPRTQLVVMTDREGDLYELHDAIQTGAPNLHSVIRAQHDRTLEDHQKLWGFPSWW